MNDFDLRNELEKVTKAEKEKQNHMERFEQMKGQLVKDDVNIYNAQARLIGKICEAKKISLEILCEYVMKLDFSHITGNRPEQSSSPVRSVKAAVEKKGESNE